MNKKALFGAITIGLCLTLTGCKAKNEFVNSALASAENQNYSEASELLTKAEENGEDPKQIARARGIISIGTASYDEAIDYFETALTYSKGKVKAIEYDISYYLAVAQYKSGKISEAIDTYSAILDMKDNDADTYFMRGKLRLESDLYDDAIRDFNSAVDNDKKNPDMYVKIYEALSNFGYDEQGQDYIDQAMALDMKFTDFQKGKLLFCKGDYDSARTSLEKARQTDEPGVILYLGRTYEALGDSNYAASLYKTYIEKKPDDVDVLNQLGLCLIESQDYDGALSAFQSALNVEGCSIIQTLKFNEIVTYEYKADFKQAAVLMKAYLDAYPDDETAQREYIFLKSR